MKVTAIERKILALDVGETLIDMQEFFNKAESDRAENTLKARVKFKVNKAKEFGDICSVRIYDSVRHDGFAVFAVIKKESVGLLNPMHSVEKLKAKPRLPIKPVKQVNVSKQKPVRKPRGVKNAKQK